MKAKPAVLGGKPVFEHKVAIVRPVVPSFDSVAEPLRAIMESGMLTKGRWLSAFEDAVREHLRVKHVVAVSSCTVGLMLTYKALGLQGGEVICPSFTFMATVGAMDWVGAKPVYVDVERHSANIDIKAVEAAITSKTVAIVAVHNFGNPANIDALSALASKRRLKLVFDAAHGLGSRYKEKPVGSQGDAQVFSLSPTKLVVAGEGGLVATDDEALAKQIRVGREYGNPGNYDSLFAGLNGRMPEISALVGLKSLELLEAAVTRRNAVVGLYRRHLEGIPGLGFQEVQTGNRHSYKDLSITVDDKQFGISRDQLARALEAELIDTRKYYDPPVHQHTAYRKYAGNALLPHTMWLAQTSLSLPIWSHMEDATVEKICSAIRRVQQHADEIARLR